MMKWRRLRWAEEDVRRKLGGHKHGGEAEKGGKKADRANEGMELGRGGHRGRRRDSGEAKSWLLYPPLRTTNG